MSDEEMSDAQDASLDDRLVMQSRAQQILAGALFTTKANINILATHKLKSGYYRTTFVDMRPFANKTVDWPEKTVVLDLTFPLETRPINEVIRQYKMEDRELFLALGAGVADYPKKENGDPKESQRAFIATDISYGIAPVEENFAVLNLPAQRYATPKNMLRQAWPESTHFFNAVDYAAIPDNTFDVIQMVNVLSDHKLARTPLQEAVRILKKDTGRLLILNELAPSFNSPYMLEFMLREYGGTIAKLVFLATKTERAEDELFETGASVVKPDMAAMLQRDYHISPTHFSNGLEEGAYCILVEKSEKPGVHIPPLPEKNLPDDT